MTEYIPCIHHLTYFWRLCLSMTRNIQKQLFHQSALRTQSYHMCFINIAIHAQHALLKDSLIIARFTSVSKAP